MKANKAILRLSRFLRMPRHLGQWIKWSTKTLQGAPRLRLITFSELGSCASETMFTNMFCFVVQVCAHMSTKCFRSDNHFLVLLPCPLCIVNLLSDVCLFPRNLLVCGDVETNQRPTQEEMLLQLLSGQTNMTASIDTLLTQESALEDEICSLTLRITSLEAKLSCLATLNEEVSNLTT